MDSFELNKIFAAILVAGIIASGSGFIASLIIHPQNIEAHGPEAADGDGQGIQAPSGPEPVLELIATADPARGEKLFRACASCHTVDKNGLDGVGPNLWNILNRGVEKGGFAYSGALSEAAGQSWEYAELNKFLWKPKKFAAETKMNFIGLKKPEDRAAMIAYMRAISSPQPPLPTQTEIDAENAELAPPQEHEISEDYNK